MFLTKLLCVIGFASCPATAYPPGSAVATVIQEPAPQVSAAPSFCSEDGLIAVHQGGTIIETMNKVLEGKTVVWDRLSVINAETGDLIYQVVDGNATQYRKPAEDTAIKILGSFCEDVI